MAHRKFSFLDSLYLCEKRVPDAAAHTTKFQQPKGCFRNKCSAITLYEEELERRAATEATLRDAIARENMLIYQKDQLIKQKEILSAESEHRLLNGLQLVTSLLQLQSRETKSSDASAQLAIAANRVATIGRIHRHLHAFDHDESIEFKHYLVSLCSDLSDMASDKNSERNFIVDAAEILIPSATAVPLGLIANELITNSIKYAKGKIIVRLQTITGNGYSLSISDDGPGLPIEFDPKASKGLGMKLILSFVSQIGGTLQIASGDEGNGTRFTILFP